MVIYLDGVGEAPAPEPTAVSIKQRGCVYVPHVQFATIGATVALINNDTTLHNVHGYLVREDESRRTVFNIAQPASRDPAKPMSSRRRFRGPGVYRIECDVHPWMLAYVVVHDSQYHALSDESGSYAISNVPAGTHTMRIWHEGLGMVEKTVTVVEGETVTMDLPIEPNN